MGTDYPEVYLHVLFKVPLHTTDNTETVLLSQLWGHLVAISYSVVPCGCKQEEKSLSIGRGSFINADKCHHQTLDRRTNIDALPFRGYPLKIEIIKRNYLTA